MKSSTFELGLSLLQVYFEPAILLNREVRALLFFDKCVGSLTSHRIEELKELWDGTSGL